MAESVEVRIICATAYLEYLRGLNQRITTLKESIERQRSMLEPRSLALTERVAKSSEHDSMEEGVIRLHELIEAYCIELAEYVEQQRIAHKALNSLSKAEYGISLTRHYLFGQTWQETADAIGYSFRGLMTMRKKAIAELYDHMPEEWRRYAIPNAEVR